MGKLFAISWEGDEMKTTNYLNRNTLLLLSLGADQPLISSVYNSYTKSQIRTRRGCMMGWLPAKPLPGRQILSASFTGEKN